MPVVINGTTGVSGVDGSASTPSYQGTDTNTGIFFPAADTIAFGEGGAEAMRIDSSGNVLVGTTTSNGFKFKVSDGGAAEFAFAPNDTGVNSLVSYNRSTAAYFPFQINSLDIRFLTGGGPERMRIDSSGKVGIGTTTMTNLLNVAGAIQSSSTLVAVDANTVALSQESGYARLAAFGPNASTGGTLYLYSISSNGSVQNGAVIDSSGNLLLGVTSSPLTSTQVLYFDGFSRQGLLIKNTANSQNGAAVRFMDYLGNVSGGGIYYTSSNSINYATSSDYRLKENIAPMTGALEKVTQLKPCTFQWTVDGSDGQGFIAHELQEVIPNAVVGEKDAMDAEGNPRYQGVDTSFLVATLTAAIQELKAITDAQATRIEALEAEVAALKGAN